MATAVFYTFATLAVASALLCVTRRSPLNSALFLIGTLFSLAGMYIILDAQFIAMLQIIVYAGAIMVVFLFVIMLLNLGRIGPSDLRGRFGQLVALAAAVLLFLQLLTIRAATPQEDLRLPEGALAAIQQREGAVGMVADPLFRTYLIPFEIASVLLLAAIVGAVVLAMRKV